MLCVPGSNCLADVARTFSLESDTGGFGFSYCLLNRKPLRFQINYNIGCIEDGARDIEILDIINGIHVPVFANGVLTETISDNSVLTSSIMMRLKCKSKTATVLDQDVKMQIFMGIEPKPSGRQSEGLPVRQVINNACITPFWISSAVSFTNINFQYFFVLSRAPFSFTTTISSPLTYFSINNLWD